MKKQQEIIEYLKKNFGAKALILCGSRAVGDYDKTSDWDIFLFTDALQPRQVTHHDRIKLRKKVGIPEMEGVDLDIFFVPSKIKFNWNIFGLKLRFSKIIYDPKNIAKRICAKALKEYKKPRKWTKEEKIIFRQQSLRYQNKMDFLLKKKDYAQLFGRICWYYAEFMSPWWFASRGEWPLRPQKAYSYIKEKDSKYYKQMKLIFSETSMEKKVLACHNIHKLLFEAKQ